MRLRNRIVSIAIEYKQIWLFFDVNSGRDEQTFGYPAHCFSLGGNSVKVYS